VAYLVRIEAYVKSLTLDEKRKVQRHGAAGLLM
jgi:hypothetical protein